MSKSVLYSANTVSQTFTASGSVLNFGSVVRKYGNNAFVSGGNAVVNGVGYYLVDVNIGFSGGAGNTFIQLYQDGVAIPGAEATVTTVADTNYAVTIPAVIRMKCCCDATITAIISGVEGTVNNASIMVEKL